MLNEHTLDQLRGLRLDGMLQALADQATSAAASELGFEERLALLVQREIDWRDAKRLARLLKAARLKAASACIEDIDWRASRGLDRSLIAALAGREWLRHGRCVLITGATGVGKTWLACALAQQAARSGFTVLYVRAPRLLEELQVAHGDGSFTRRLAQLARTDLLAIDDFAIAPLTAAGRNDLLELLDDRVGARATLITSQLPVSAWHEWFGDPTLADAILDRVVHAAHKIALKGESMRKISRGHEHPADHERRARFSRTGRAIKPAVVFCDWSGEFGRRADWIGAAGRDQRCVAQSRRSMAKRCRNVSDVVSSHNEAWELRCNVIELQ